MATASLVFDILARDRASRELTNVGNAAEDAGKKGSRFGDAMKAGLLAAAAGAVAFGKSSIDAYKESEQSSIRLDEALRKFPATNDRNRASFDRLNESLAKKTRFDDDATASGQAVLAQFKLTGTQIQELTPLLQDYAAKTGRDLPAAATVLGKAMLGNAKALKEVGINLPPAADATKNLAKAQDQTVAAADKAFKATQALDLLRASLSEKEKLSAADKVRLAQAEEKVEHAVYKHREALSSLDEKQKAAAGSGDQFSRVTEALRTQVGGFAEKEGKTAAGQAEILRNRFGEVQEKVGAKLVPALTSLIGALISTIAFTEKHHKVVVPLAAAVGALTLAVLAVNAATAASTAVTAAASTARAFFTTTTVAATGAERASTISRIASTAATAAQTVATGIATVATTAWTVAQTALNVVLRANPIGIVVTVIAALVAGIIVAYKNSDTFRGIVDKLWASIKTATSKLGDFLGELKDFKIPGWVRELGDLFGSIGGGIKSAGSKLGGLFGDGPGIGGSDGDQPRGVKAMMAALPAGTQLISGLRPGAITATGNPSYHAQGRAVDLPPSLALFNYIKARFGAASKELIFSPAGSGQIHNGRPHYYGEPTRSDHFDHVHWAMHQGGQVGAGIARSAGDGPTERTVRTQVGEVITTGADMRDLLAAVNGLRDDFRRFPSATRDLVRAL